jgi:AmiR/NasT family two-component response regulator
MSNLENVRVLVAEDDYLVAEMVKGLLEDAGYTIVGEAADGLKAVEMTQSLRPDVVMMDIGMPDMDGIEATRLIYERCPTPVVILTAYETEELVESATEAGVGAYLVKPPSVREIERAISVALACFDDMMKLRGRG